eukprot:gb/GEZN01014754.1/.p1 GENE.gb/GEZN01014754.1/~~gb/GEZN01014754.1/.p1  ORF type:complete len:171 (-),score=18.97 gb/GEZN01014754.1/:277-789(-)
MTRISNGGNHARQDSNVKSLGVVDDASMPSLKSAKILGNLEEAQEALKNALSDECKEDLVMMNWKNMNLKHCENIMKQVQKADFHIMICSKTWAKFYDDIKSRDADMTAVRKDVGNTETLKDKVNALRLERPWLTNMDLSIKERKRIRGESPWLLEELDHSMVHIEVFEI